MPEADATPCSITPESKLGDLLARWPALEETLVALSPHFKALKNPVLRRTVARLATLRQVSQVSGVSLGALVSTLRAAAGQAPQATEEAPIAEEPRPAWAAEAAVTRRRDARAAIDAGEHPLPLVMRDLAALGEGEVYELLTPFVPAPLIEVASGKGYRAWSGAAPGGATRTCFGRRP